MNLRGWLLGMLFGAAVAVSSILFFEAVVWGWSEPAPDYMVGVSTLWGVFAGFSGSVFGEEYL